MVETNIIFFNSREYTSLFVPQPRKPVSSSICHTTHTPPSPSGHSWIVLCVDLASRMSKLHCNVSSSNACKTIEMSSSSHKMTNICVVRKFRMSYQSSTINFPGNTVWCEDNSKNQVKYLMENCSSYKEMYQLMYANQTPQSSNHKSNC